MPKAQAARTFEVGLSSVKRYVDKIAGESLFFRIRAPAPLRSWTKKPQNSWRRISGSAPTAYFIVVGPVRNNAASTVPYYAGL